MEVYFFSKYECDVKSFSNLNISNDYFFNKEKKNFRNRIAFEKNWTILLYRPWPWKR